MNKIKVIFIGIVLVMLLINGVSSLSIQKTKMIETNNHDKSSISNDNKIPKGDLPTEVFNKQEIDEPDFAQGEFIVKFKSDVKVRVTKSKNGISNTGISSIDRLNKLHNVHSIEKVFNDQITSDDSHDLSYFYKFTFPKNKNVLSTVEDYKRDINIAYAGPNYILEMHLIPNDPYYYSSGSWGQTYSDMYGLHLINASGAWDVSTGSHDVIVAVVDSGIDYNHADIIDNLWINQDETPGNGIDDDDDGFIDNIYGADFSDNDGDPYDYHGHGTHCAGTIAAVGNNSLDAVGVNWQCKIMALKGFPNSYSDVLGNAIKWAADNGANVISNSWGSIGRNPSDPVLEAAIRYAFDAGCTIVFSAGNNWDDVKYYSPQNMEETITVAATDYNDEKASFSNYGEKVDVCAPGVDILSLRAEGTDMYLGSPGYEAGANFVPPFDNDATLYRSSGTSMSCPHVAGLAALLLSKNQSLSKEMIRTLIGYTSDPVESSVPIGRGRINASEALHRSPAILHLDSFVNPYDAKGTLDITGTAWGENFQNYTVEYGIGQDPVSWIEFMNSTVPVQDSVLASLDTTVLDENMFYTIRLNMICSDGIYQDTIWMLVNNEYNLLYVDDDNTMGPWNGTIEYPYKNIQDAINYTAYRDDIYVFNGTYHHIVIDRSITLIGEDKYSTILDRQGNYNIISIYADDVNISGFTIQNSWDPRFALYIESDNNNVSGNIFKDNVYAIKLSFSSYNIFSNNIINNNDICIEMEGASNNTFSNNIIANNGEAITLYFRSWNNVIENCEIYNNMYGVLLYGWCADCLGNLNNTRIINCNIYGNTYGVLASGAGNCTIENSTIFNNNYGVQLQSSKNFIIRNCDIYGNSEYGISINYDSDENLIYHNNFFDNGINANDESTNQWDDGSEGNYWDDYTGEDENGDGIGDTPYVIPDSSNQDNYPFMDQDGWVMINWWPMFHHNRRHTGYSSSPAPNTNTTIWSQPIGWKPESSPAVAYGNVYVGSKDDKVFCFDAETGDPVWNYTTRGRIGYSSPAIYNGKVYIGSAELPWNGTIYCLDAITGEELWKYTTDGSVYSSPTVSDGYVYVGSHDKNVYCLDAETGEYVWSYATGERVTSSPTVANGKVYVGSLDGKLYCLDASDGSYLWDYATFGPISYSSAAVVGDKVYFGSCDSNVYCIDIDGNFIWSFSTGAAVRSSPVVAYGNVYIGSYDNKVYCLDAEGNGDGITDLIWEFETGSWVFSSPAVADDKIYVGSRDGTMYCLNATIGNLIWSYYADGVYPPVGGIGSSPAIAEGKVYFASTDGHLYAFGDLVLRGKLLSIKL